ncbi:MAG: alpha/beta fold hydrolase [Proteobacteria bacterium]|nr:alpha/beta fold hydrolase [Pseudomonadota bacterium]
MRPLFAASLALVLAGCPKTQAPEASAAAEAASGEATPASPDAVVGDWIGDLVIPGASLRLALHITGDDDLAATLDSPDQGGFGIPASSVTFSGDQLRVEVAALGATYEAKAVDGALDGTFSQGGGSFELRLERGSYDAPSRPQEPEQPLPYTVEDVSIAVEDHALAGTLTLPEGDGPFPAVVLITGSGPQDRDEAIMGHRPFYVLADRLTRAGIAVLRTDDRGVGASTGDFGAATTVDFADDATAAMAWLRARDETAKVGFLGHSEGGMVAPLADPEANPDFHVLFAAPGIPIVELMLEQQEAVAMSMGVPEEQAKADRDKRRRGLELLAMGDSPEVREELRAMIAEAPEAAALPPEAIEQTLDTQLSPWWTFFTGHDPAESLGAIDTPVLAIWGSLDVQVLAESNRAGLEASVDSELLTTKVYEGLNHLFQSAETGSVAEYATIEETLSEQVMTDVSTWILENAH